MGASRLADTHSNSAVSLVSSMIMEHASPVLELETTSPEVKCYQRQKLSAIVAATALGLAYLAVLGFVAGPLIGHELTVIFGDREWLRLLAMAGLLAIGLEVLTSPIDFWSGFILEHRYQLSNQSLKSWIWKRLKGYLVGGILGLAMLSGLYTIMWLGGENWWLWTAGCWLLVTLVLGQLVPVVILPLFYKVTRLEDPGLAERLQKLAAGTGLTLEGVYRLHLSAETKKANAALAGLGRTRRVLLGDTLLEQFTPEEIEVVFAHEVGHHVHRHLPKMVAVSVLLATAGFWLVDWTLHRLTGVLGYAGFSDPAALPLVLLVLSLLGLLLSPLQNALSRFFERQCDRYALDRTGLRDAYRAAFVKLARINKSDPDPHPLVAWLFYDHPPIRERLAMAGP
ncbi:MAG: M48 family metallopeptidase [Planctomycetes bacterium]|nr:M48 family metallopeptidase [Planctomycetota bacterium]